MYLMKVTSEPGFSGMDSLSVLAQLGDSLRFCSDRPDTSSDSMLGATPPSGLMLERWLRLREW